MKSPQFSIVVPIYKVENYIDICVESVLSQTFTDFELILVDDGSPDNCPAICDQYSEKDPRIKVVHKTNGGLVDARRTGAAVAEGEYVVCVDGDDFIEPMCLEIFKTIIDAYAPDVISCGYYEYLEGEKKECHPMKPYGFYDKAKMINEIFPVLIESEDSRYYPPSIWAKTYKRELYQMQQQQVPGLISIGEDHACTKPCIYHAESMYVLDRCLYNYRQNPTSMTKNKKAISWDGPKAIGQHFEKQIDMSKLDFQAQVYRNVVHNVFNVAVSQFYNIESYYEIRKSIIAHIQDGYYQKAINECRFARFTKGWLAHLALKKRLILIMLFYSRRLLK